MTRFKTIAPVRTAIRRAFSGLILLAAAALSTHAHAAQTTHPRDPLPPATCLSGTSEVTCGRLAGTYVVTLKTTGAGGAIPDHVSLTPMTAGVTIVNAQPVYPVIGGKVKIVLAGANPGDTIVFNMEGTTVGLGAVEGADLCCNGSIKIVIPKDIDCPHGETIDVAINKTGGTSPAPQVNGYAFHLAVTNVGAPFNGTNAIVVKDVVPAGMTFTSATGTDWMCATLPALAGSAISCTYTGSGPASSGQSLGTIDIAATASGHAPFPPIENCASVGVLPSSGHGADGNPANNRSCVIVKKPDESTVSISKSCDPVVFRKYALGPAIDAAGLVSMCHIKVVTTGPQTGTLSVGDQLAGGGSIVSAASTTTPAWACSGPACSISGSQLNQTSSVSNIDVLVAFPDKGTVQESKNCAMLAVDDKDAGKDCTGFTIDDPKSTVSIRKTCEPAAYHKYAKGPAVDAVGWVAMCHITVSTTGAQTGALSVSDSLAGGGSIVSAASSTLPAWSCSASGCSISGSALDQNASTSVIDVLVDFPSQGAVSESKNCASVAIDGAAAGESCTGFTVVPQDTGTLTVEKVALYNGRHLTGAVFQMNVTCGNTARRVEVSDGKPYVQSGIPVGTDCGVSEIPASTVGLCPEGQIGSWATSYAPNEGVTIPAAGATVTVTNTLSCLPIIFPKPSARTITKVCDPAKEIVGAINHYEAVCHITVSTVGPQSGTLTVDEGLVGNGAIQTTSAPSPWTCAGTQCTADGAQLNAASSDSTIDVTVSFPDKGAVSEAKNCATLDAAATPVQSCATFTVEPPKDNLAITVGKTCDSFTELASGGPWVGQCHVTVNVAGGPMPPLITIGEALHDVNQSRVPPVVTTGFQSADPWTCPPMGGGVPANTPLNCTIPGGSFPAGGSSVIDFQVFIPRGVQAGEAENCVSAAAFQTPDTPSSPLIASDQVCVPLPGGPKNPPATQSRLDVKKEVVSNAPMPVGNLAFPVFVTCSETPADGLNLANSPNGAFSLTDGQSALAASGTYSAGATCTVSEGAIAPTTACGNLTPKWTTTYLPSASVGMNAPNQTVTIRNQLDCEPVNDQAGGFSVTKTCDPAIRTSSGQNVTAWCYITVTVTGTPPSTINVGETLQAFASPANRIDILNSGENWTYPALPIMAGAESVMTIPSSAILAAGGTSVIRVRVELADAGTATESQNCVRGAAANGNEGIDHPVTIVPWKADTVCVPFTVGPAKATVAVEKTCQNDTSGLDSDGDTIPDTFTCQIKVTLTGSPATGNIFIEDSASGGATIQSMSSTDPWDCNWVGPVLGDPSVKYCAIQASVLPGGVSIINVVMHDNPAANPGPNQECAHHVNFDVQAANPDNSPTSCAPFPTTAASAPALCGDGIVTAPEQCDDGNSNGADACSTSCTVQSAIQKLACDPATATPAGDLCRCRFDNMNPVSKTACQCKDGFSLKAGQGCVRKVAEPKCDPATTVTRGGKCVCEYKNMVQSSASACACAKGFKFAAGKGCFRPEPVCKQGERFQPARGRCEPVCGKGFDYSVKRNACIQQKPDCPAGTVYSAKTNRCVPAQPVCKPPFTFDAKRNACVQQVKRCEPGTIPFKGKCLKAPKCGFGEIPVPGTGICVSIGGGGGRPKGGDQPQDTGGCIPTATRVCK